MITNKTILIISPQNWNFLKISKHYYAEYLSYHNKVYFLNPITNGFFNIQSEKINDNLNVITFKIPFAHLLKFKLKYFFSVLVNFFISSVLKKIDVIWNFDNTQQFYLLKILKPKLIIFHPVDATSNVRYKYGLKPHIILSVSELILNNQKIDRYKYLINHGLSEEFISKARENLNNKIIVNSINKVAYSGNLDISVLNKNVLLSIINLHKNITFYLIGPINERSDFYKKLSSYSNVVLTGKVNQKELNKLLNEMDMLILNYKNDNQYQCDNSHKILEYLSTGKIILSSKIKFYENKTDLIIQAKNDEEWINLFNDIVKNPLNYNNFEANRNKLEFAISNSYQNHLNKISSILKEHNLI